MNKLPLHKRAQILQLLCEGSSMRAAERITGASIVTISKLLVDVGRACMQFHEMKVQNIESKRIQADEVWNFVAKKSNVRGTIHKHTGPLEKHQGDLWTWIAIDADTRLIITWVVGHRDLPTARHFMRELREKTIGRFQLTTDGLKYYTRAVDEVFGADIDYAQMVKTWDETSYDPDRKYSTHRMEGVVKRVEAGDPDMRHAHTNHIERQNLTMRMCMRRYTRLTNGFSKKVDNHMCALALHFVYYNFIRLHKSLRVTPAMEAGLADDTLTFEQLLHFTDQLNFSDLR